MTTGQRRVGIVLGYINIAVKNLVQLAYTPMLLSFMGEADYGVFQTSNSFVFSLQLLSLGFAGAYLRFYAQRKESGDEAGVRALNGMYLVFYAAVSVAAVALGLCFSAASGLVLASGFTSEQVRLARTLMAVMAFSVAATLFGSVFDSYIVANERFAFQQTRQIFTTLATPLLAFALLCVGMGPVGVALAQLAVNLVLLALNVRYAVGKLGMRFDLMREDWGLFKAVAVFSGWLLANQVCDLVNQNVPNVLLGAISGAGAVAVFSVAVQIRSVFFSLSLAISNVFASQVNRLVARGVDDGELTRLMTRAGRLQMMVLCWVLGGFAFLGEFFVTHWAGEGFADAYWLVLMMAVPLVVPLSQNVGIEVQKAKNMHKARSAVYLIIAAGSVIFTAALSGALDYWAPAVAYAASISLGNGLWMNWYYHKRVGMDMVSYWKRNFPVVFAAVAVTVLFLVATRVFPVASWLGFVGWGLAYTTVYLAVLLFFVMDEGERSSIFKQVRGR